jgi:hypothetical protein
MLEMQRLHVKHADDIIVSFSECGIRATVRTHPESAAPTYELTNCLRDHGCCSCVEGTQEFFCVHHLLVLCAKFNQMTRDSVCDHAIILVGSSFGTSKGCQLGKEGIVPLVTVLRQASGCVPDADDIEPTGQSEQCQNAKPHDQPLECVQNSVSGKADQL